jgi:hypothetical protein
MSHPSRVRLKEVLLMKVSKLTIRQNWTGEQRKQVRGGFPSHEAEALGGA